jgi:hypothetical protein
VLLVHAPLEALQWTRGHNLLSPLRIACSKNDVNIIRMLLQHGAAAREPKVGAGPECRRVPVGWIGGWVDRWTGADGCVGL